MNFGANKTPVEIIKEAALGGTSLYNFSKKYLIMVNGA